MKFAEPSFSTKKIFSQLWQPGMRHVCYSVEGYDIGEVKEKLTSCLGNLVKRMRDRWGGRSHQGPKRLLPDTPCRSAASGEKWQPSRVV